jgi:hypothetical protein
MAEHDAATLRLKQGAVLSTLLLNVVLDAIVRRENEGHHLQQAAMILTLSAGV